MTEMHKWVRKNQPRRESATADNKINSIITTIPANDPINDPDICSQNELNCWHIDLQFALTFPLCAKYTMAAAADAPAVNSPSIPYFTVNYKQLYRNINVF